MKQSRKTGFVIIAAIYIIAAVIAVAMFLMLKDMHIFPRILIADVAATVFVFLTGVALRNASVYDPYWSVAPIIILTGMTLYYAKIDASIILILHAVWFWGVRLTCNWAYTFKNLNTQDWRYDHFKRRFPRIFQLVSFVGINMFPTIVVYLCLLPAVTLIEKSTSGLSVLPLLIVQLGFMICTWSAALQLVSDMQMHKFRRENAGKNTIIRKGLWKYARHPNYLFEITMWWGVYIMMLGVAPQMWFLIIGPVANTLLFLIVSIPLADRRNRNIRPGFEEYLKETRSLLPIRKRNK